MHRRALSSAFALLAIGSCFRPDDAVRGAPCTNDASCGDLKCEYGVCGGPQRCEAGASVGDYCFALTDAVYRVGDNPSALAAGFVNFDPHLDVVVGDESGALWLLLGDGLGALAAPATSPSVGGRITEIALGNLDASGWADVVVTTENSLTVVPVYEGEGGGIAWGTAVPIASDLAGPRRPLIGGFVDDSSGLNDLAVLVDGGIHVRGQTAPLTFGAPQETYVELPTDVRAVGSGMDIVYVAAEQTTHLSSLSRTADGKFISRAPIETGVVAQRFLLDDLDDDNYTDALAATASGEIWLVRAKDTDLTNAHAPARALALGWAPQLFASARLDDDRAPEIIVSGSQDGKDDVYLLDNDGDGRLGYGGSLGLTDAAAASVGDLESDGVPELLIVDRHSGELRIARRTVAPPPPGGGKEDESGGTTGSDPSGVADSGGSEGQQTEGPEATSAPDDSTTSWPVGPCDGVSVCYGYLLAYSGPLSAQLVIADVNGDGNDDLAAIGVSPDQYTGDFLLMPGYGDYTPLEKDPKLQVRASGSALPNEAVARRGWEGLDLAPIRFVSTGETGVAEWDLGLNMITEFAIAGAQNPVSGYLYGTIDTDGAPETLEPGLDQIVYSAGLQIAMHDNLDESPQVADVISNDVAISPWGYTIFVATDAGGVQEYFPNETGFYPGQLLLGGLLVDTVAVASNDLFYALYATDGTTLWASKYDYDQGLWLDVDLGITLENAAIVEILFGDLTGDYNNEVLLIVDAGGSTEIHVLQTYDGVTIDGIDVIPLGFPAVDVVVKPFAAEGGSLGSEFLVSDADGYIHHYVPGTVAPY